MSNLGNTVTPIVRRAALDRTFEVKKRRVESRLKKATDTRIIRMHQGEIRNLDSRWRNAIDELKSKRLVAVSYEPVACGTVELGSQPG